MMADCSKYILLSKSAQVSCGLMISWSPFRTANPYTMCVQSSASISLGRYLPTPCLQEQIQYSKSSFNAGGMLPKSQRRAKHVAWIWGSHSSFVDHSGLLEYEVVSLGYGSKQNLLGLLNPWRWRQQSNKHKPHNTASHPKWLDCSTYNHVLIPIGITKSTWESLAIEDCTSYQQTNINPSPGSTHQMFCHHNLSALK